MGRFLRTKLLHSAAILLLVTFGTSLLLELVPGDPAYLALGENPTPEQVAKVREDLRLDDNVVVRYARWAADAATGDLGDSIRTSRPVIDDITQRLPVTLELAILALIMAIVIAVPWALLSASRAGSRFDRFSVAVSASFISSPAFFSAIVLVLLFSVTWGIFPVTGWIRLTEHPLLNLKHAFLPALSLALAESAQLMRLLRTDLLATFQEDFVLASRARGLSARYTLWRHALRPSSVSFVTVIGVHLGRLLGGAVIVEFVFALPGLGAVLVESILGKDYPLLQGVVLVVAVSYLIINALLDVVYALLDPRVRVSTSAT